MNYLIDNMKDLEDLIAFTEKESERKKKEIEAGFKKLGESLQPGNLIKNTLRNLFRRKHNNEIISNSAGVRSEISEKIFRKKRNPSFPPILHIETKK